MVAPSRLALAVATISALLGIGMVTAGGYLLDRGLWSLLKLRDRGEESIEPAYSS